MERKQISILVRALILATLLVSGIAQAQDGGAQSPSDPAGAAPGPMLAGNTSSMAPSASRTRVSGAMMITP